MAFEEYLLNRAAETKKAAMRFYSFPRDSIVLGYAQDTDIIKKLDTDVDLTRRATGGSHVQVGNNVLAYTFVVPRDGSFKNHSDMRAYYADLVANALIDLGLDNLDVNNKASTINYNNKVIASHAIIWGVKSALLHGIVIIDPYDVDNVNSRVFLGNRRVGNKIYTEYSALKNIPALSKTLNKIAPNVNESTRSNIIKDILGTAILKNVTKGQYKEFNLDNNDVLNKSKELLFKKYNHDIWIKNHKPTFTKEKIEEIPGEELDGPLKKNLGYCLYIQVENKDFKLMAEPEEY